MKLNSEILDRFERGLTAASSAGIVEPTAMNLATLGTQGVLSSRTVLLKDFAASGFVFYTNLGSRKSRQLQRNSRCALTLFWDKIFQQVLIEGTAQQVSDSDADEYFAGRPRGSQIGAWASKQSQPLDSRQQLEQRVAQFEAQYAGQDIPRPAHWSGFCVDPDRIEFWYGQEFRLHDRFCYEIRDGQWRRSRLYP
jgi:pyridoxamine 5'-phosphate oxidase